MVRSVQSLPAATEEEQERHLISLAMDLAERKLRDGTASSQMIVHILKLATEREKLERDILRQQRELMAAKTESIKAEKRIDELYQEAVKAVRRYNGEVEEYDE